MIQHIHEAVRRIDFNSGLLGGVGATYKIGLNCTKFTIRLEFQGSLRINDHSADSLPLLPFQTYHFDQICDNIYLTVIASGDPLDPGYIYTGTLYTDEILAQALGVGFSSGALTDSTIPYSVRKFLDEIRIATEGTHKSTGNIPLIAVDAISNQTVRKLLENLSIAIVGNIDHHELTNTPLGGGAAYTSGAIDMTYIRASEIYCSCWANVAGGANSMQIQQSSDGVNWDSMTSVVVIASTFTYLTADIQARYCRFYYLNGAGAQGAFRFSAGTHTGK
jgi:hypothetical protein